MYRHTIKILNDTHSRLVQERLFAMGYKWANGSSQLRHVPRRRFIKINSAKEMHVCFDVSNLMRAERIHLKDVKIRHVENGHL